MRSASCDRCGVAISPSKEPAELRVGGYGVTFDVCEFCAGLVRTDMVTMLTQWREALDESEVEA